jgi:hypothetical protein
LGNADFSRPRRRTDRQPADDTAAPRAVAMIRDVGACAATDRSEMLELKSFGRLPRGDGRVVLSGFVPNQMHAARSCRQRKLNFQSRAHR